MDAEAPREGFEPFLIRTVGGPHPGTRLVNTSAAIAKVGEVEWPLPDELPAEGGVYVKTAESSRPKQLPDSNLVRGASYEWRPAA